MSPSGLSRPGARRESATMTWPWQAEGDMFSSRSFRFFGSFRSGPARSGWSARSLRSVAPTMFLLCAVLTVPVLARAQLLTGTASPPMPRLEFDAAIKQALDRNPNVAQATVAIARADALLQQSRAFT